MIVEIRSIGIMTPYFASISPSRRSCMRESHVSTSSWEVSSVSVLLSTSNMSAIKLKNSSIFLSFTRLIQSPDLPSHRQVLMGRVVHRVQQVTVEPLTMFLMEQHQHQHIQLMSMIIFLMSLLQQLIQTRVLL